MWFWKLDWMPFFSRQDEGAWLEKVPGRHLLPCAANIYWRGPVAWILRLKMRGLRQEHQYIWERPQMAWLLAASRLKMKYVGRQAPIIIYIVIGTDFMFS